MIRACGSQCSTRSLHIQRRWQAVVERVALHSRHWRSPNAVSQLVAKCLTNSRNPDIIVGFGLGGHTHKLEVVDSSKILDEGRPPIMPEELKIPAAYSNEVYARGLASQRPAITFDSTQWEPLAKQKLSAESWAYVYGNAGQAETRDKNLAAFRKWSIVPSRLHGAGLPSLETTVLGQKLPFPIALAPVGVQKIFHGDAELATARAAAHEHVPYIHSTAAATSIEAAAAANGPGTRWFQLYWPGNDYNDLTVSLLQRAKRAGYTALFVTLDTYTLGWRPMDLDNAYNPFIKPDEIGSANGLSDPVFRARFAEKHNGQAVEDNIQAACMLWLSEVYSPVNHSWEDVAFLQKHWDGPIVLKGIQSVVDAKKALAAGVQGILVSNHGGRQQDGGAGSLDMLPGIVDAVGGKLEIFFDSGVRCGADIIKALALGADMVLVGRPYVYGLALGGESGVRHVTRAMLGDLQLNMHLSGIKSVDKKDLNRDWLRSPLRLARRWKIEQFTVRDLVLPVLSMFVRTSDSERAFKGFFQIVDTRYGIGAVIVFVNEVRLMHVVPKENEKR
nr:putative lactate 2-monooxygenase pb1a11.03 [Quercus suber]